MSKRPRRISTTNFVVGIDLGGTHMQIGVVDARHRILLREGRKTGAAEGRGAVVKRIVAGVREICEHASVPLKQIAAVGIAAPGAIDMPRGIVLEAPNLRWRNVPLRDLLQKQLGRPIVVDNDVNGAVWGEHNLGANRPRKGGKRAGNVLGAWVGTGLGGGLIIDGKLHYGDFFTAGEIGHTVLFPAGAPGRKTAEDFCSRTGISRTIQERLTQYPNSLLHKLNEGSPITSSRNMAEAYRKRDPLTVAVINEAADLLGVTIANQITMLSLGTVIIGGGVSEALGRPFLQRVHASFQKHVFPMRCRSCKFILTRLRENAGLLGAALLARQLAGQSTA